MQSRLVAIFLRGLLAVLPIGLTAYVLVWFGRTSESVFATIYKWILPLDWYIPGMGLVTGLVAIFVVGLSLQAWIVRQLVEQLEKAMLKLPLVKTLYGALKDFLGYFAKKEDKEPNQAVLVELSQLDAKVIGFVTNETLDQLKGAAEGRVAVYLPMSYQLGGYTLLLRADQLTPIDMPFEEAMRFAITAGVAGKSKPDKSQA
jgi:uncharacterized membrane protein